MHKVSIVTGTWNRFDLVCQMIESALNQTYPIHEIIVVDDCSPDDAYSRLLAKYRTNAKVKVFTQLVNTGGVPNWNAAINYAQGDWIAWCSDDDQLFKDHIENCMSYIEQNPDVSVLHAAFATSYEIEKKEPFKSIDNSILSEIEVHPSRTSTPIVIQEQQILPYYTKYYSWPFHPSTLVFKREVWENIGEFNPKYELADSEWFIRVVLNYKVAYLPHLGVLNRRHNGNWSNAMGSIKMQLEVNEMMQTFIQVMKEKRPSIRLNWNAILWKLNYEQILFRIFISRVRHGMLQVADDAKIELKKSSIVFKLLLNDFTLPAVYKLIGFFRKKDNFDLSPK